MSVIFDRVIGEFFPGIHIPYWKKWVFRAVFGNKVSSRLINDEWLINKNGVYWVSSVVDFLSVRCEAGYSDLNNIPRQGATVVISNHPTVMGGVALIHAIAQARKDIRVVANHILLIIFPQMVESTIGIEDMAGKMNRKKFREVNDRLKNSSVLTICLVGKSASRSFSSLQEHQWNPGFLQLAMRNNTALVPVHITGSNSKTHYLTATTWRQLSNIVIIREALCHCGKTMKIKVRQQITLPSFNRLNKDLSAASSVCLMHLQSIGESGLALVDTVFPQQLTGSREGLINAIEECGILRQSDDDRKLLMFRCNILGDSPIVDELGHLRECCHRDIGAGSGKDGDNGVFDETYYHVVL